MLWYLLKTWPGREEELVGEIRRTVPPYLYKEAFVIYNERIWRHQGRSIVHTEPLFKGCVFLTCPKTEPLFQHWERVPAISRLMAAGYLSVFPLTDEDAEFLKQISGEDHVVRLSHVLKESGQEKEKMWSKDTGFEQNSRRIEGTGTKALIYKISGPLEECLEDVESIEFRKRFVKLRRKLWGEEQVIALGIVLNEDVEQKMLYENLDVSVELPENYTTVEVGRDAEGKKTYTLLRGA